MIGTAASIRHDRILIATGTLTSHCRVSRLASTASFPAPPSTYLHPPALSTAMATAASTSITTSSSSPSSSCLAQKVSTCLSTALPRPHVIQTRVTPCFRRCRFSSVVDQCLSPRAKHPTTLLTDPTRLFATFCVLDDSERRRQNHPSFLHVSSRRYSVLGTESLEHIEYVPRTS